MQAQTLRSTELWNEERTRMMKRAAEDQKKLEKLSKKGSSKPVGLPKEVTKVCVLV